MAERTTPPRIVALPATPVVPVLTATVRGMIEGTFIRAAQRAYTELMNAVAPTGHLHEVRTRLALVPEPPRGPNDPLCRYIAGLVFGHAVASGEGQPLQPEIALGGSLAWTTLAPGRYAVFTHVGPYDGLKAAWEAAYTQGLCHAGLVVRRDAPPFELSLNTPEQVAPAELHTEIWIPVV